MYFPSVLMPEMTSVRTVIRTGELNNGTLVLRDTFNADKTIEDMVSHILNTAPQGTVQEMKVTPPFRGYYD